MMTQQNIIEAVPVVLVVGVLFASASGIARFSCACPNNGKVKTFR